jgi:hypothetical protein
MRAMYYSGGAPLWATKIGIYWALICK